MAGWKANKKYSTRYFTVDWRTYLLYSYVYSEYIEIRDYIRAIDLHNYTFQNTRKIFTYIHETNISNNNASRLFIPNLVGCLKEKLHLNIFI